jgi:hypothetical protein
VVEVPEAVAPPPLLEVGGAVEGQAAPKEVVPLVAPTVDRNASALTYPEAGMPPASQASGSGAEVSAAPEASVQPQDVADVEGPHLSRG